MCFIEDLLSNKKKSNPEILNFVTDFLADTKIPKYVLGRNMYSEALIKLIKIDGIVDDFSDELMFHGCPILKLNDLPANSLVLNAAGGRPLTSKRKLDEARIRNLDYFAFQKHTSLPLPEIRFNEGFEESLTNNKSKFQAIYEVLADSQSREIFEKLVRFRYLHELKDLDGFSWREDIQYFEEFLELKNSGESFIDVGAFDGYTSHEFIKICQNYASIDIFEPDAKNIDLTKKRLSKYPNINYHNIGLSNEPKALKFSIGGSCSKLDESGSVVINVDRLDSFKNINATFIKMDIEGAEINALEGARGTIIENHPRLAISVYHHVDDFWRVPEKIFDIRSDYKIYMRHYTESIYETVMFFMPVGSDVS